jgi:hypothetical protein
VSVVSSVMRLARLSMEAMWIMASELAGRVSYYADPDVMPTAEAECLGGTSAGSGTIGITGQFSTERFAERKREPRPL